MADYSNFLNNEAPPELVEEKFFLLRESPILVYGNLIDCDEDSLNTMRQALRYFDEQLPLIDVFEDVGGEKRIMWRLSDNTKCSMSKAQLSAVLNECEKQKALRASILYAKKRTLKDGRGTYSEMLTDWV